MSFGSQCRNEDMSYAPAPLRRGSAYLYLEGHSEPFELGQKFQFGRTPSFNDSRVSVHHFTIAANSSGIYYLLDNNSATGTKVKGILLKPNEWLELKEGCRIAAGPYMFQFSYKYTAPQKALPREGKERRSAGRPIDGAFSAPLTRGHEPASAKQQKSSGEQLKDHHHQDIHKNDNTFLVGMASLNIIVFAVLLMTGGNLNAMDPEHMLAFGANLPHLTTNGQWWRLFSAAFLHWDIWHLVGNVAAMYFATAFIIQYLTPNKIIAVYLGSLFFGNIISAALLPTHVVSAGASGAVFGLYGAIIVSAILYHERGIKMDKGLVLTALYFAWQNLGVGVEGVDYLGHIGGFLGGAIISYACIELLPENDKRSASGLFGALTVIMMVFVFILPARMISGERQMAQHYTRYIKALEVYYLGLKSYDRDKNLLLYTKVDAEVMRELSKIEVALKAEKPVDQKAANIQSKMTKLVSITRNHAHYLRHFIRTGSQKSKSVAKKEDQVLGALMHSINAELGVAQLKPRESSPVRRPATRK